MLASPRRLVVGGVAVAVLIVGFLVFRPDTLFTDVTVDESLEEAFATETSAGPTSSTLPPPDQTNPAPTQPVGLLKGTFTGIEHRAIGTVTIYGQGDRRVLRFEDDTYIQNGPDLYVWVLASNSYEGGLPTDYLDLGRLTGNVGGQNYELPENFDPEMHRTVLIWCLRFRVPFAAAPLS